AAVGDRKRHVRVLLDDEDRDAGLVHLLDDLEVALDEDGREAHRRLVHQEQLRPRHQRPPHRDHLLLPARQGPCELRPPLVQQREQLVDAVEVLLVAAAAQVGAHLQVLEHRHRREQTPVLRHDRDPAGDPVARRPARHVLPAQPHRSAPRPHDAQDRLQRRRLARGVAAEQADELPLVDVDREALQDVDLAVVGVDRVELEQGLGGRHFFAISPRPRYASTTRGSVATWSNEPSAILTPWSSATTRSEIPSTTCMSCSITRIVYPPSSRSLLISAVISWVSTGFMPAAGSSSRSSVGFVAVARAISSRRLLAYESE